MTEPIDPVDPKDPVEPKEPVDPQEPKDPVDPKDPAAPKDAKKPQEGDKTLLGKNDPVVPEKYEFKLEEGMAVDEKGLETFTPIFKELKLTNEQAQKLVDVYAPYLKQQAEASQENAVTEYKKITDGWLDDTQKEYGAEIKETLIKANKVMNKFGSDNLRVLFDETGIGNNKEMVKFLMNVASGISEDSVPSGQGDLGQGGFDAKKMFPSAK